MEFLGTTIVAVKRNGKTVMAGDGQVTLGQTVMKATAKKVRRLGNGKVVTGFAGSVADAFTLFDRFETKLREANGNLKKAAVELAKDWRTDRVLRRLEALLMVADNDDMFLISGNGEIIEPDEPIMAIGSGGSYALAAARALYRNTEMEAKDIAVKAMEIASEICIYTNSNITVEEI
jgi:ATP-dependent HslUV protease subunit HslV